MGLIQAAAAGLAQAERVEVGKFGPQAGGHEPLVLRRRPAQADPEPAHVALHEGEARAREVERLRELRRAISSRIEADIALLDAIGGDPDLEPSPGAPEPFTGGPAMDWTYGSGDDREADAGDDREVENEHGSDEDAGEPSLCGLTFGLGNKHDREGGDDTGIGDSGGLSEQWERFRSQGGNPRAWQEANL